MNISDVKKYTWEKYWAGNWSFSTAYYFAFYYSRLMKKQMGAGLKKSIIITNRGYSYGLLDKNDRRCYGKFIGAKVGRNKSAAMKFCKSLKQKADSLLSLVDRLSNHDRAISNSDYNNFIKNFLEYSGPHVSVRHTVDYLSREKLDEVFNIFEDVRIYVEKVYKKTEEFFHIWANQMAKKTGLDSKLMLCFTPDELKFYFKTGILPEVKILQARFDCGVILFDQKGRRIYTGKNAKTIIASLNQINKKMKEVSGTIAYPGHIRGRVRVIFEPKKFKNFTDGDILVTGMTRPEFLPLMHKAGAVVTDAGGILSHAAIVAREMKKPCIIGTEIATKIFKDGDFVEVDAEKGVVRKI